ncbi:MAG: Hsp33 family molecular chaperone HslO [Verrucomicrobia bacterium]|nr:Hsp33 family molecular chaperone HslO [Verrucomicrobiota bacterium]
MSDILQSGVSESTRIRFVLSDVTMSAKALETRHLCGPAAGQVLAEGLAAVALLSADTTDENETVYIRLKVDGPVGGLLVEAMGNGDLRGFPNKKVIDDLDRANAYQTADALGTAGAVEIVRSVPGRILNQASLAVRPPALTTVVARFYNQSLQIPAAVDVYVRCDSAGIICARALLAEKMPDAKSRDFVRVLESFNSGRVRKALARHSALPAIAPRTGVDDISIREERALRFRCRCSPEKVRQVVATFADDSDTTDVSPRPTHVTCHMCGRDYTIAP